jgi:hypothetical protein
VPLVTDDAAREREQWPGGGRVQDEATQPYGVAASPPPEPGPSYPDGSVSGSPYGRPYGTDQYGLDVHPVSGGYPSQPVSGGFGPQPVSGGFGAQPSSDGFAAQPVSGGFPAPAVPLRRIEPSPPPQRGKMLLSLVIGLLAGALLAGTGAYFLGRASADGGDPAPAAAEQPAAVAALIVANRAKFPADLTALAEPWFADMSGCAADTDSGGPERGVGQRSHVLCRDGGMYLHFVAYESADAKSADLGYRQQIALNSPSILPGGEQPGRKLGGVTGAPGTYVEYATRSGKDPALCGFWWNRDNTDAAVYVDVICDSLGGKWDPLRAVWQRHS